MPNDIRFTVFDPRRGAKFDLEFGRRKVLRLENHNRVILFASVSMDRENSIMTHFLSSFIERMLEAYREDELLIQHGPPIYKNQEANRYPAKWRLVIESRDSHLFYVTREQFADFADYFGRASHYEQWMFYLVPNSSVSSLPAFEPRIINRELFINPPFFWNGLLYVEGDFGTVLCFLPFSETTDHFVETLVLEGCATYAPRDNGK